MKTPLFILIIFSVVQISCSNQNFDIIIDNKRNETTDSLNNTQILVNNKIILNTEKQY